MKNRTRRQWFGQTAMAATGLVWGGPWGMTQLLADPNSRRKRFVLIFLEGGWNSQLAIDPVYGAKASSGAFEEVYQSQEILTPGSKDQLRTGLGMQNALSAFAALPTAFINGLKIDIPAHDTAKDFMLTGKNLVGRSVSEPCLAATLGEAHGGFASHVVLGGVIPLGTTYKQAPPLVTTGDALGPLLAPPGIEFSYETRQILEASLSQADDLFSRRLGSKARDSLAPFRASQNEVSNIFETYGSKMIVSDELKDRYQVSIRNDFINLAAAQLVLKHGLSDIVTIMINGFDTHANELTSQLPLQQNFSEVLARFIADLMATEDLANPGSRLSDSTTILVTSEFVRTPKFNATSGTDHQATASAILMGQGVTDNLVMGQTDSLGQPMGWLNGQSVPYSDDSKIDAGTLIATLLDWYELAEQANSISEKRLDGLLL